MRIVMDTNLLFDKEAMARAAEQDCPIVLPAVAFAERVRQFQRNGWSHDDLLHVLEVGAIEVESFGVDEALRLQVAGLPQKQWARLARDAFIAGHVGPNDQLWTKDVEDFVAVGVPREQIVAI